jgi:hypothetical protein
MAAKRNLKPNSAPMSSNHSLLIFSICVVLVSASRNLEGRDATQVSPKLPDLSAMEDMKPAEAIIITLEGTAVATDIATGKQRKLSVGDRLLQGTRISTNGRSKVGLGFTNGTFLEVGPDSQFTVQEFFQEPWDADSHDVENAEAEPSRSRTTLFLNSGQVLADIKKLKSGSGMEIVTPLASAGIRGTKGQITHTVNSDGSPQRTNVNVPEGAMTVTAQGGGDPVTATGSTTGIVSTSTAANGQGSAIQITTGQSTPQASAAILQSAQALQARGMAAFVQGIAAAAQSPQSFGRNLSPEQRQQIQEAGDAGEEALVGTVTRLSMQTPELAPEIAQFAALVAPELAPQIASAAVLAAPGEAVSVAVAVSVAIPVLSPQVAASVAVSLPGSAAQVAGAVAGATPSSAADIAGSVTAADPSQAPQIAQAVAQAQPQQVNQIAQSVINSAPQGDANAIRQSAQGGAQSGTGTGGTPVGPMPNPNPNPPPPPPPTATPTPVPSLP